MAGRRAALSPVVPMGKAFATLGASFRPLRYGPVLMLDYAIQFIALAVPSSAARLALDIRFFGRNGIDAGGAISISAITSVCGFVVQVLLIVVIGLSGLATLELGERLDQRLVLVRWVSPVDLDRGPGGGRRDRHPGGPEVPDGGHPGRPEVPGHARLAGLLGRDGPAGPALALQGRDGRCGKARSAAAPGGHPRALPAGVRHHATMAELILVNSIADLLAGFMPVPGGMGVAEAAYTAGLVALGVPSAAAMSTAIAFRMVTYYLPPIWGAIAMRWLRQHAYL